MRKLIARLICRWKGHRRGRLVSQDQTHKTFECPRCGRNTIYPVKKAA